MSDITVTVRMFGAFRQYGEAVKFTASSGLSVQDVREKIVSLLGLPSAALVRDSAFALEDEVVPPGEILTRDCTLAILPPVCGG